MKKLLLFVFLISGFIFQACEEDEEVCQSYAYSPIVDAQSPDTLELNIAEYVQVAYTLENTCGDINFLQIDSLGDDTLSFQVRAIYEGCDCNEILLTDTISYFYTPLDAGRKYLKFVSPDSSFFYDTLFVVDPEG